MEFSTRDMEANMGAGRPMFLSPAVKRSVNWLPLSVNSLMILTGHACCTFARKSTLLLSVWSAYRLI